jgi:protein O-GlcNAc transferase
MVHESRHRALLQRASQEEQSGRLAEAEQRGDREAAFKAYERAADFSPESAEAQWRLGRALRERRLLGRAIAHLQCAVVLRPKSPELLIELAGALREQHRYQAATALLRRALALAPNNAGLHHDLAQNLLDLERCDEALQHAERAAALAPDMAGAFEVLGSTLLECGRLPEAIAAFREAVERHPNESATHSNLIFLLPFALASDARTILDEGRRWAARFGAVDGEPQAHGNDATAERKLRIGYVSHNFNRHCQSLFMLPLLRAHDREGWEIYCYSGGDIVDEATGHLRAQASVWRDIAGLDNEKTAELIRADQIDILIDLTMHMAVSRLPVFARKPAPVQIAWLAYPGTTGLSAIDYRLTDRHLDPPGEATGPYAETSLVLPDAFWCYHPLSSEPLGPLPARIRGHVTFGCLNAFWKLNDEVFGLWAKVLEAAPESRLLLLAPSGSPREHVKRVFAEQRIAPDRLDFVGRKPRAEYLKNYHNIDICLDGFPYNGHTTSLDAFWMGVPVVTLVGKTIVGRAGLCMAHNLGLPELVAQSPNEFVQAARSLALDLDALEKLRAGLRQRLESSPLMDAPRFARNFEHACRGAFRNWCAKRQGTSDRAP